MSTRSKTAPVVMARLGGVSVDFDDVTSSVGLARLTCEAQVRLSPAGLAAALGVAQAYLVAAKITALQTAGATVTCDANVGSVVFSCLPADAAGQVAALTALTGAAANVTQTGGFVV